MEKLYCNCFFGYEIINNHEYILNLEKGDIRVVIKARKIIEKLHKINLGEVYVFDTIKKNNKIVCRGIYSISEIID